jgi:hypothetical protein
MTFSHLRLLRHSVYKHAIVQLWAAIAQSVRVTRYGMEGPRIESRWGRDFPQPSRPALGPHQPPRRWVPGLSRGLSGRGVALTTHTHTAPRLKEK